MFSHWATGSIHPAPLPWRFHTGLRRGLDWAGRQPHVLIAHTYRKKKWLEAGKSCKN